MLKKEKFARSGLKRSQKTSFKVKKPITKLRLGSESKGFFKMKKTNMLSKLTNMRQSITQLYK